MFWLLIIGLVFLGSGLVGGFAGVGTGTGFVEGFVGGLNIFGNIIQAGKYLWEGKPVEAGLSLLGQSESRIEDVMTGEAGFWAGLDPNVEGGTFWWGDRPMDEERLLEMGRDLFWSAISFGGIVLAKVAWPVVQSILQSSGLYFALGSYAGGLRETIADLGGGYGDSGIYDLFFSEYQEVTGDASRHDFDEAFFEQHNVVFGEAYLDRLGDAVIDGIWKEVSLTAEEFMAFLEDLQDGELDIPYVRD